jgi:hypothetical protein
MFMKKIQLSRGYSASAAVSLTLALLAVSAVASAQQAQPAPAAQPAASAAPAELTANITKIKGQSVQASHDNGQTWQAAKVGDKLSKNGRVRTGFASECEVSFAEQTLIQVQPLSSMNISDYSGTADRQKVKAEVLYGGVRCGVEKGRVTAETQIATPVSTLSIRGTIVYVEYDPGTRRCLLWTVRDGPALAQSSEGKYQLDEGMDTDCSLSRFLERASFRRDSFIQGYNDIGAYDNTESRAAIYQDGATDPTQGSLQNNTDKNTFSQRPGRELEIPGGDVPIGGSANK